MSTDGGGRRLRDVKETLPASLPTSFRFAQPHPYSRSRSTYLALFLFSLIPSYASHSGRSYRKSRRDRLARAPDRTDPGGKVIARASERASTNRHSRFLHFCPRRFRETRSLGSHTAARLVCPPASASARSIDPTASRRSIAYSRSRSARPVSRTVIVDLLMILIEAEGDGRAPTRL